jgi:hypothetical protein
MDTVQQKCLVCLEEQSNVSECNTCNNVMCHSCEEQWTMKKNNPYVCTICKNKTRYNVSPISIHIFFLNSVHEHIERRPSVTIQANRIEYNNPDHCTNVSCVLALIMMICIFIITMALLKLKK